MADESTLNFYVQHAVMVERYAQSVGAEMVLKIALLDDAVAAVFNKLPTSPTQAQINKALLDAARIIDAKYGAEVLATLHESWADFTPDELAFQRDAVQLFAGEVTAVASARAVFVAAESKPFEGATMGTWAAKLPADYVGRMERTVKNGYVQGMTTPEVVKELEAATDLNKHHARTVARTSIQHIANEARETVFTENADVIGAVEWVSTLDGRTTHICQVRDGKVYTTTGQPIGHEYPWLGGPGRAHWNCRSTSVPYFGDDDIVGRRPSVQAGEDYKRGDMWTRTGKVRKMTKDARERGIYAYGTHNSTTKYEQWLRQQPAAFVNDVLGVRKGEMFRQGATLDDFSDRFGRPLTLRELRQRNAFQLGQTTL